MKTHCISIAVFVLLFSGYASAQWTEPVRISEPGGCWYPQIVAQGDTIHVVYTNTYGGDKISYARSIDGGNTWGEHVVLSDAVDTDDAFFPRIMINGNNIISLWMNVFSEGVIYTNIGYSISHNGGTSWGEPNYVFNPNIEHIYHLAATSSGQTINIIYSDYSVEDPIFRNVRSTNFGQSWSDPETLFIAAETGQIDMVAHGYNFHCVWYGNFNDGDIWETYYSRSLNSGFDWSENIALVDVDDYGSIWPSLSINESGDIIFCWTDFKYSPNWWTADVFMKCSYDNGETWTGEERITFNDMTTLSDVFWRGDSIYVVWEDERFGNQTIYFIKSLDGGINWSEEYRIESESSESRNPAVAASNGKAYVIWADDRDNPDTTVGGGIYFTRWEPDVSINEDYLLPADTGLLTAYPNPFNSTTLINYSNLKGGDIDIYDISGRMVKKLHTGGGKEGSVTWDATDASGEKVSSGIYFARARSKDNCTTEKLVYLK